MVFELSIAILIEADSEAQARMYLEDKIRHGDPDITDMLAWDCEEYDE